MSGCSRTDPKNSEVSFITKQQFMTELSKLLTFMYDEDRQRALKMYERMFAIAEDDQGLIQHLMSPTRQAVVIARAYDAKERKLSVSAQKKGDEYEESTDIPPFVLAINKIFDELFPEEDAAQSLTEDQVSFFDLGVDPGKVEVKKPVVPKAEVLLSDTQNFPAILPPDSSEEAEEEETEEEEPEEEEVLLPEPEEEAKPAPQEEEEDAGEETPASEESAEAQPKESNEAPDAAEDENHVPAASEKEASLSDSADEAPEKTPETASDEEPEETESAEPEPAEAPGKNLLQTVQDLFPEEKAEFSIQIEEPEEEAPKKRRRIVPMKRVTNVPLLVLFLILAIPITLLLLILLLIPTLLSFSVSLAMIALGVTLILAAFSGFAVLADVLLLFGAAIIALALGLVFLWISIWLIGGVMVGLVRAVRELAQKWCTKEVPVL